MQLSPFENLHVSDSSSVHHQEFFTVHTAMVYVIQVFWQLVSRSICSCSQAVSKHVWHIPLLCVQWKLVYRACCFNFYCSTVHVVANCTVVTCTSLTVVPCMLLQFALLYRACCFNLHCCTVHVFSVCIVVPCMLLQFSLLYRACCFNFHCCTLHVASIFTTVPCLSLQFSLLYRACCFNFHYCTVHVASTFTTVPCMLLQFSLLYRACCFNFHYCTVHVASIFTIVPCTSLQFSLLYRACCFSYLFNIPTNAHNIYTLKNTKIHIKIFPLHVSVPFLRPSSGVWLYEAHFPNIVYYRETGRCQLSLECHLSVFRHWEIVEAVIVIVLFVFCIIPDNNCNRSTVTKRIGVNPRCASRTLPWGAHLGAIYNILWI
jgi:hypothetical protein